MIADLFHRSVINYLRPLFDRDGNNISAYGKPINLVEARNVVSKGGNVYVKTRAEARQIAGRAAVKPEIDRRIPKYESRFWHYHLKDRKGGHTFYGPGTGGG